MQTQISSWCDQTLTSALEQLSLRCIALDVQLRVLLVFGVLRTHVASAKRMQMLRCWRHFALLPLTAGLLSGTFLPHADARK